MTGNPSPNSVLFQSQGTSEALQSVFCRRCAVLTYVVTLAMLKVKGALHMTDALK